MTHVDFDFARYVQQRRQGESGPEHGGAAYAYPADQRVLRALRRVTPVKLAAEATVRLWRSVARGQLLGSCVKVSERQFGEIHHLVRDCARRLQIALPTVYVAPEVGTLNAHTFGTRDDAYIVINGVLVDYLERDELKFVIGHECGHIHNEHVVFNTALYYLMYSANVFVRWIVQPAILALQSWSRRAEITCDRAGLLCCGDLDLATRAIVKLALGSRRLAGQVDIDEYVKQLEESRLGAGGVAELTQSHPYLPKRVAALRLFAKTHYFLSTLDPPPAELHGESLNWCDARVGELLAIFGSPESSADRARAEDASDASKPNSADREGQ